MMGFYKGSKISFYTSFSAFLEDKKEVFWRSKKSPKKRCFVV